MRPWGSPSVPVTDAIFMNGTSIFVMKPFAIGGTGLVHYSRLRLGNRIDHPRSYSNWRWHLDEVFVKINGETHYLWRAFDHEGEVPESFVTKRRDRRAALAFLKKAMKRYGPPKVIVTGRLRSYWAAMVQLGNARRQEIGRWLNSRGENSHLPFRRREYSMQRFRREKTLQKFVSVHSVVCNHFNHKRHLISRDDFLGRREATLVEWQQVSAA